MLKRILILIVILTFVLTGCQKGTTLKDQIIVVDNFIQIEVNGNNTLTKKEIESFIQNCVKTQPQFLLEKVKKIIICNDERYESYSISKTSSAFANPNDMSIYIRVNVSKETMTHELTHIYDYADGYHYYSESEAFSNLYKTYKGTFHFYDNSKQEYSQEEMVKYSFYFNESVEEFFAEASQLFINNPNYLKDSCLPLYDYFQALYPRI